MRIQTGLAALAAIALVITTGCGKSKQRDQFVQTANSCLTAIEEMQALRPDSKKDKDYAWLTDDYLQKYKSKLSPIARQLETQAYDDISRTFAERANELARGLDGGRQSNLRSDNPAMQGLDYRARCYVFSSAIGAVESSLKSTYFLNYRKK